MKNILSVQTFIMSGPETYWDYRDYVFCLCSSKFLKNQVIRFNVERGTEWLDELKLAAGSQGFEDFKITGIKPESWSSYMLEQIGQNPSTWVFPFPGDHIYVHPDTEYLTKCLKAAEQYQVQAVSFGHNQDWDYFLDWRRIKIIENNSDFVIIEWGNKHRFCKNRNIIQQVQDKIGKFVTMPPVPGFMILKSDFFSEILKSVPKAKRWQDMEYASCRAAWSYRVLIPKQYLYRHVHGYWLEYYFEVLNGRRQLLPTDREILDSMYIKTNYDWKTDSPKSSEYFEKCLQAWPLIAKYTAKAQLDEWENFSPFNNGFKQDLDFLQKFLNTFNLNITDNIRRIIGLTVSNLKRIWK